MKFILRITFLTCTSLILGAALVYGYFYFSHIRITTRLPASDAVFITPIVNDTKISTLQPSSETKALFQSNDMGNVTVVKESVATEIVTLWRNLKFSPFRPLSVDYNFCRSPGHRLRFMKGEKELLDTTIYWRCDNFKTSDGTTRGFDSKHKSAKELRKRLAELALIPNDNIQAPQS